MNIAKFPLLARCALTLLLISGAVAGGENCTNGIDDDGDRLIDGNDPSCTSCSAPTLNFENPVLQSGTAGAEGAKYLFSNVLPNTNAILTIVSKSHSDIDILSIDEPRVTNGGYDAALQPIIDFNWLDGTYQSPGDKSVTLTFNFVDAVTGNPVSLPELNMTGLDIDGMQYVSEFLAVSGYQKHELQSYTELTLSGALEAAGPYTSYDGVQESILELMILLGYQNVSSITLDLGGTYSGGGGLDDAAEKRLSSLYFKCYDFDTTVTAPAPLAQDYGDAPAGYGEAKHGMPPTPSVYLGTTAPDGESPAHHSADARGDDTNGDHDEDAFTSLSDLATNANSYDLTVPCAGTEIVAGWIDFDRSGTFTNESPNSERASAECSGGSATLTWNAANSNFPGSLTAGDTFARLRTASDGICKGKGLFGTVDLEISGGGSIVDSYIGTYDPASPGGAAEIGSNGNVKLSGSVSGSVRASGTVDGSDVVSGDVYEGVPAENLPAVAACSPYSDGSGISATGGLSHDTGTGDITVSGGNTLTLAPGTYCFNKFTLSGGGMLRITGPTDIYLTDKGTFSGGTLDNTTLDPDNLRIFSASELTISSGGTRAYMSIYAPGTNKLTISGGGSFYGCAVGGEVTLSGDTGFHQDLSLDSRATVPTGPARDGEVEDYGLSIVDACTGLSGDVSEAAPAMPLQVGAGDKVFVASSTPSPAAGHLTAYSVNADGSISGSAAWDAATLMDATERQNGLYSTDAAGSLSLFDSLDDAAFASAGTPTVAQIKAYTIDPSYNGGTYLAGRSNGSFLGTIGRGNDLALVTRMLNMPLYLEDSSYRSFYSGTVSSRTELVLVGSDDGFLYAFDQTDGALKWAWMPRFLAGDLQHFDSFQSGRLQRGKLEVIDAKDGAGAYATYVVGAYKNGLGHYVLKLDGNGGLADLVWDEDRSASFATSPNNGDMGYFRDGADQTYAAYVLTTDAGLSTLVLRNVAVAGAKTEVALALNATSTPYIMPDFADAGGPAAKTLYLGLDNGAIRRTALLDSGALRSATALKTDLEGVSVGDLGAAEAIRSLGAAPSMTDHQYYLRAQSDERLTLLQYDASTAQWDKLWTSYVTGAGSWDSAGDYTADNSGAPTDSDGDGFATDVPASGIQSVPAGARLTDGARIVADSVILPVTVPAAGACYDRALYYLYRLTDGQFPDNAFYGTDGVVIVEDIVLGFGEATHADVSDLPSQEQLVGYGHADQAPDQSTGVTAAFLINESISTGIRGWKELR